MNLKLFNIAPTLPPPLAFLEKLSYNMWWCWHPLATELFLRLDPTLWQEVEGNSRKMLNMVPQSRLEELAKDPGYLQQLKIVQNLFEQDVRPEDEDFSKRKIAYFSMEFGIHESVRIFSGGLGVLSGDHLKAASDLHLPLAAVGLLYRQGYFRQVLDRNGWQTERYPENEIQNMPLRRARDAQGNSITISILLKDRPLYAAVWLLWVGNIPLVLLDTEIAENPPEFREITWRLYGGDKTMRIHQELLLGVGGYKAFCALGMKPQVCHMNEGHAAFMSLARLEELTNAGLDPDAALEVVWRTNVFTTHTPVPAGNEVFQTDLLRPYLKGLADKAHMDVERIMRWGMPIAERESSQEMSMTVLGLRMANYSNGVSKLHGAVAREMWKNLWPNRSVSEIPIKHITNGIHVESWIATRLALLYDRYMPPKWEHSHAGFSYRDAVNRIPDSELWAAHELNRQSLVRKVRQTMQGSLSYTQNSAGKRNQNMLDPDILTIGFARRFATYKRGTMLLRDPERLLALMNNEERPVQFVFAGKAHPADNGGKKLIQDLVQFAREHNLQHRLIFIEDYDIGLARDLVQGVDVWLNNPRRPQEASGTSGMKAAINGVPNCSILDGWWDEAYTPDCGWAIAGNPNLTNPDDVDNFEANSLYSLLEKEIIPSFYERDVNDIPVRWVKRMKASIEMSLGFFTSERMVAEYDQKFYEPACESYQGLVTDNYARATELMNTKHRLMEHFPKLWIGNIGTSKPLSNIHTGDTLKVTAEVYFGALPPESVDVEVYYGPVNVHNEIVCGATQIMQKVKKIEGEERYLYECELKCDVDPGRFGLTAQLTPAGHDWDNSVPGFSCWA